jgi:hypothetical protein
MSKFKIGDRVKVLIACSGTVKNKIYTIERSSYGTPILWTNKKGNRGCTCQECWELAEEDWDR